MRTLVIAEAGVNHNGSTELARKLVDAAVDAGADIVKFQTFRTERLVTKSVAKAAYQAQNSQGPETQFEMLQRLELSAEAHHELREYCERKGIEFLSTPFDEDSLTWLVRELGLKRIKLSSGDITNGPLLLSAARHGVSVILSTGMSTLREVEEALAVLAFGYTRAHDAPSRRAFHDAYTAADGQAALRQHVTLLHCTSEYPSPYEDVNLKAMETMQQAFGLPVGLSDHTPGTAIAVAAAARGATVIEKHFTLDKSLPGPDHKASLEPHELRAMIDGVRAVETALGNGVKIPAASERRNQPVVRKSVVAARAIRKGERFCEDNLAIKRSGDGISPMFLWDLIGRNADRDYEEDELIQW